MNSKELKKARGNVDLTQCEVAKKLGIATKTYNRKELGLTEFTRKEILQLFNILYLSAEEFDMIFFENKITKM